MIVLRSVVFDIAFYMWTTLVCIASLPVLLISQRATARVSWLWARVSLWFLRQIVGLSFEVRGLEYLSQQPAIYAFKHQSAWDTLAIWVLLENPAIVLKASLAKIPLFGSYIKRGKAIVVDRKAGASSLRPMVASARAAVKLGRSIAIFPEGTRTPAGHRQAYQPGVAALYLQLGIAIVPVALNSGLFWSRRSFVKRLGHIVVAFLSPIHPGRDRRSVMAELEQRIEAATTLLVGHEPETEKPSSSAIANANAGIWQHHRNRLNSLGVRPDHDAVARPPPWRDFKKGA
jgi:1-acyl-sn-glycerol-3-phosphate acyltransferase